MTGSIIVVLIICLWLMVLAPLIARRNRPVRRAGKALEDTRVVHAGGQTITSTRRRPTFGPTDVHAASSDDHNAPFVQAEAWDITNPHPNHDHHQARVRFGEDETPLRATDDTADNETIIITPSSDDDTNDECTYRLGSVPATVADDSTGLDEGPMSADAEDADTANGSVAVGPSRSSSFSLLQRLQHVFDAIRAKGAALKQRVATTPADHQRPQQDGELALSPQSVDKTDETLLAADSPDEQLVLTSPNGLTFGAVAYQGDHEHYRFDESFTAPADLCHPEATYLPAADVIAATNSTSTDPQDQEDGNDAATNTSAANGPAEVELRPTESAQTGSYPVNSRTALKWRDPAAALLGDTSAPLSQEDYAFAEKRKGRGGFDPTIDRTVAARRRKRRLVTIAVLLGITLVGLVAGVLGGGMWWLLALTGIVLTVAYLTAIRRVVRAEQRLRARRIQHIRRARLGVKNAADETLGIPARLRRPGAIVVEVDDESPDFHELSTATIEEFAPFSDEQHGLRRSAGVVDLKTWARPRRAI